MVVLKFWWNLMVVVLKFLLPVDRDLDYQRGFRHGFRPDWRSSDEGSGRCSTSRCFGFLGFSLLFGIALQFEPMDGGKRKTNRDLLLG